MQEHFKVQRRIEEKNIIKEHWRPHSGNWSQKENHSVQTLTTASPEEKTWGEENIMLQGFTFPQDGFLRCSEVPWHLDEIRSGCSVSALYRVMISPSLLCKTPFLLVWAWKSNQHGASEVWPPLLWVWVEITLCLPPWSEGISYLPPPQPWVCTHGEMPTPPKRTFSWEAQEELNTESTQPGAQQTQPWLLGKGCCVILSSQQARVGCL